MTLGEKATDVLELETQLQIEDLAIAGCSINYTEWTPG